MRRIRLIEEGYPSDANAGSHSVGDSFPGDRGRRQGGAQLRPPKTCTLGHALARNPRRSRKSLLQQCVEGRQPPMRLGLRDGLDGLLSTLAACAEVPAPVIQRTCHRRYRRGSRFGHFGALYSRIPKCATKEYHALESLSRCLLEHKHSHTAAKLLTPRLLGHPFPSTQYGAAILLQVAVNGNTVSGSLELDLCRFAPTSLRKKELQGPPPRPMTRSAHYQATGYGSAARKNGKRPVKTLGKNGEALDQVPFAVCATRGKTSSAPLDTRRKQGRSALQLLQGALFAHYIQAPTSSVVPRAQQGPERLPNFSFCVHQEPKGNLPLPRKCYHFSVLCRCRIG